MGVGQKKYLMPLVNIFRSMFLDGVNDALIFKIHDEVRVFPPGYRWIADCTLLGLRLTPN
jgi:hypothetical protein